MTDHSLLASDFKAGQLPAGPPGPKGDTGAPGQPGPKGDVGPAGISGLYQIVAGTATTLSPNSSASASATCPAGKKALSGGAVAGLGLVLKSSAPFANRQEWTVAAVNQGALSATLSAVVCATVNQVWS